MEPTVANGTLAALPSDRVEQLTLEGTRRAELAVLPEEEPGEPKSLRSFPLSILFLLRQNQRFLVRHAPRFPGS